MQSPARRSASVAQPSPERIRGDPNDPHTLLKAVFQYYCRFGRTGARGVGEKTLGAFVLSAKCDSSCIVCIQNDWIDDNC